MYLEDAELSWKVRQLGRRAEYTPLAAVYHKYTPDAPHRH